VATLKSAIFLDVTTGFDHSSTLNNEAEFSSEMSVNFRQTTQRHIIEGSAIRDT
jgi:hypothetical protein